jgi:hypothetical protein
MTAIGRRGSVRQARNGSWYFVVDASYPGASRHQTRRRGFATERAAQSALTALLSDLGNQGKIASQTQTLVRRLAGFGGPSVNGARPADPGGGYGLDVERTHQVQSVALPRLLSCGPPTRQPPEEGSAPLARPRSEAGGAAKRSEIL